MALGLMECTVCWGTPTSNDPRMDVRRHLILPTINRTFYIRDSPKFPFRVQYHPILQLKKKGNIKQFARRSYNQPGQCRTASSLLSLTAHTPRALREISRKNNSTAHPPGSQAQRLPRAAFSKHCPGLRGATFSGSSHSPAQKHSFGCCRN